jgi:hypothetical protein
MQKADHKLVKSVTSRAYFKTTSPATKDAYSHAISLIWISICRKDGLAPIRWLKIQAESDPKMNAIVAPSLLFQMCLPQQLRKWL